MKSVTMPVLSQVSAKFIFYENEKGSSKSEQDATETGFWKNHYGVASEKEYL
jgi:hypothetical protein